MQIHANHDELTEKHIGNASLCTKFMHILQARHCNALFILITSHQSATRNSIWYIGCLNRDCNSHI